MDETIMTLQVTKKETIEGAVEGRAARPKPTDSSDDDMLELLLQEDDELNEEMENLAGLQE